MDGITGAAFYPDEYFRREGDDLVVKLGNMNYLNEIFKCINRGKINMDEGSVKHKQITALTKVERGRELGRS